MLPTRLNAEGGFTASERYLAHLCERSFLSLWSHPNLFRDPHKELCDLLVVFGEHVIVFSDKSCALKPGPHGWSRWYRRAIVDSAKQLQRAAGWLRTQRTRVFMDNRCTVRFPFELPAIPKIHLVAVALGAAAPCREHFGGGSGSLLIDPVSDGTDPFTIGDVDPSKPFVHVLDETSLNLILGELDTIDDVVRYLEAKEAFVRSGRLVRAAGEEDLLAWYLQRTDDNGRHGFVFANNPDGVILDELWDAFSESREYRAKKQADEASYLWDKIIEEVAKCATEGRLVAGNDLPLHRHERCLRFLAAEPRVARRALSKALLDVFERSDRQDLFARTMQPTSEREHVYVFLTIKRRPQYRTEERYREFRRRTLLHYSETVKLRQPETKRIAGLAFGARSDDDGSIDTITYDFDRWTDEDAVRADENRQLYGWSADGADLPAFHGTEWEYPDSQEPTRVEPRTDRRLADRERRAKRKAQRAARKKNRR